MAEPSRKPRLYPVSWTMFACIRAGLRLPITTDVIASATGDFRKRNRKQASGSSRDSDSASQTGQKHKVKPGDTLGHLAQQYYGA
ncbi:MAG: hypothetical protein P8L37_08715, partial [Phycisphaerales bacterium]|nr:hypothetical protein [Phycisphaerales bacterium]